jgi:hypothetical protein
LLDLLQGQNDNADDDCLSVLKKEPSILIDLCAVNADMGRSQRHHPRHGVPLYLPCGVGLRINESIQQMVDHVVCRLTADQVLVAVAYKAAAPTAFLFGAQNQIRAGAWQVDCYCHGGGTCAPLL